MSEGNLPEVVLLALGAHCLDTRAVRKLVVSAETPISESLNNIN